MRRPRYELPLELKGLHYNSQSGYYEISEFKILYRLHLEEVRSLRNYFAYYDTCSGRYYPTVYGWYADLDRFTKKKVIRLGDVEKGSDDFYPDREYE